MRVQYAAVRAFLGGPPIERYLLQSRRILSALGQESREDGNRPGSRSHRRREGSICSPISVPGQNNFSSEASKPAESLCESLLQDTGVAFCREANSRPERELTARLAYVDFDGSRALEAAESSALDKPLDAEFAQTYCDNVLEAIDLTCEWFNR